MGRMYPGHLPEGDPLQGYLRNDIQPLINGPAESASYRVFRLHGSNDVYLYEDRVTGATVVGNFSLCQETECGQAVARMTREFDNLRGQRVGGNPY